VEKAEENRSAHAHGRGARGRRTEDGGRKTGESARQVDRRLVFARRRGLQLEWATVIKLKRLKINRYRNVEPCDLVFSDRFNILLGPNGAGKTTLLNLISKVLRTNLADTSDPFSIEIELSFPGGTLSGKIETFLETSPEPDDLPSELREARADRLVVGQAMQVPQFELRLIRSEPPSTVTIIRGLDSVVIAGDGVPQRLKPRDLRHFWSAPLLGRAALLASSAARKRTPPIYREIQNTTRFDESLDTFRSITAKDDNTTTFEGEPRPRIQYVSYLIDEPDTVDREVFPLSGIVPASILDLIQSGFNNEMTGISFNDSDLKFLSETCRLLGLRAATAKFELAEKQVRGAGDENTFELGHLRFLFTRKTGDIFQDQHLSYGQKRLLTFLYYLEANPSIIIADELVNGLHHAWIKECMEAIGERQAFLTSQNPLLLDYLFFTSVQEVKESFILCRIEPVGDSEKMIWRNLTDDEAAMFYSAYKVGIEHVGEILRTRGLW
jgi:energy-coupling factor transporter ATP-binding protein EcfA2